MHWETKKFLWLILSQYSLYCSGLELNPNPQYLQGVPIECSVFRHCHEGGREQLKY